MKANRLINLGNRTALISFILGTIILIFYAWMRNDAWLVVGASFILFAIPVNLMVLWPILKSSIHNRQDRKRLLRTIVLMLFNIPIMYLYIFLSTEIGKYMWVTITNDSGYKLTDIHVQVCGEGYLKELEADETESIWVKVIHECPIGVRFDLNGKVYEKQIKGDGFGREEYKIWIDSNGMIQSRSSK